MSDSRFRQWSQFACIILMCTSPAAAQSNIRLVDVTSETGISFAHQDGSSGKRYIVENISAGVAIFDYDGDGLLDIYFLNGGLLKDTQADEPPRNALYKNLGEFKFEDVTDQAGVGDSGHSLGVVAADYDNDGDLDLYVTNFGPNVLYQNNGDGTFTEKTREAGLLDGDKVGAGAAFLDIDNDGDLDLYVSSYVQFTYKNHRVRTRKGVPSYAGPLEYAPEVDSLYRNNGDGTFTDITAESGIGDYPGSGMGILATDHDNDGDIDIFVGNDVKENFLFDNDGAGKFEEVALIRGLALDFGGIPQGSMGVACGDYDNDGLLDIHVTTAQNEVSTLYKNTGDGMFADVTRESGAGAGTKLDVAWGNAFIDFDNDGDRDLFLAMGHFDDNAELRDATLTYKTPNILLLNDGKGHFTNVSKTSGSGLSVTESSRGAAFDDLDNDGDIDVVVLNSRSTPTILRNDSETDHHWVQVQLKRSNGNVDAPGARVRVFSGDLTLVDEVRSGTGYQSHCGTRLHFGLGQESSVQRIEVQWPGGKKQTLTNPAADQLHVIDEE